jgi:hypothetical protein
MKLIILKIFFLLLAWTQVALGAECSLDGESCCLTSKHFKKLHSLGIKNRLKKFGNRDIIVGRWSDKSAEKITKKAYRRGSSSLKKKKFFAYYRKGWSYEMRAGEGLYVVTPLPKDPFKYKQLLSSSDYAPEKRPVFFGLQLDKRKLIVIDQGPKFEKVLMSAPGYRSKNPGTVWFHFDKFCSSKLRDEVI